MVKRIGTARRKTRSKLKKDYKTRGKISLTKYFQEFKEGDTVSLKMDSAVQTGNFHGRFYGKRGIIAGMQGKCYEVKIKDQNKEKTLIVHPIHLKRL